MSADGPHAIRDGYLKQNAPRVDQSAGLIQLLADAANGICYFDGPIDCYIDVRAMVAAPVCHTLVVKGINNRRGPASRQGGSRIVLMNDLPIGTAPDLTPAIDLRSVERPTWDGVTLTRPAPTYPVGATPGGIIPSAVGGFGLGESYRTINTSVDGVSSCFIVGHGPPNANGFDHSDMENVFTGSCGASYHIVPGSNAAGDQVFDTCDFDGTRAAFLLAASGSSGFGGCHFRRVGLYGSIGWYRYDDGSGQQGGNLLSNNLKNVSSELAKDAVFYDQMWNRTVGAGHVSGNIWAPGFYQSPQPGGQGWGQNMQILSNSGTTLVLKVTPGFKFEYGMRVFDIANDPKCTRPLATVMSIDEPWPYSTDNTVFQATLHLDQTIALQPGAVARVNQPKIGTIVTGAIDNEVIQSRLMRNPTGLPVFVAGRSNVHDVMIEDWQSAKALEAAALLFGGRVGTGNWAGYEGNSVRLGFGVMGAGQVAGFGEFVCGDIQTSLRRYDGSAPARGVVLRTAGVASGGSVGYQRKASDRYTTAPCVNHTAADIPASTYVKPDPATGGILPCLRSDPQCVGMVDTTAIPAGSVGTLQALWCDTFV